MARSARVLVVDDLASVAVTLAAYLELEGLEVADAPDGARALEMLTDGAFDLVLSDVRMPRMNGLELFRAIRKQWPTLPVILMTAFAVEDLIKQAIAEGVFTVVSKPYEMDHIVGLVTRAMARPKVLIVDGQQL